MVRDFDFNATLDETKKTYEQNIVEARARIALLDELKQFFKENKLKVVQTVADDPVETAAEKPAKKSK